MKTLHVYYKNWRGEYGWRRIEPITLHFSANQWHKEPQWLLRAVDLDKSAEREFAFADILFISRSEPSPEEREKVDKWLTAISTSTAGRRWSVGSAATWST